jgi:CBS domain containing-hemolysin-like protein
MLALLVAFALIAVNGVFVAAEFAIVKARATQLRAGARRGDRRATWATGILSHLDRYLSVCQLGVTAASLGLGWIGEPALTNLANRASIALRGEPLGQQAQVIVAASALAVLTFGHVLLGELVPKFIAIQHPRETMLHVALPLRLVNIVGRPILWLMEKSQEAVLRLMGLTSHVESADASIGEEEIVAILAADARRSARGSAKADFVDRVLRFSRRTVKNAMIPRVDVASLPFDTRLSDAIEYLRSVQYSRVLLTRARSLDEVVGYLYAKDLLLRRDAGQLETIAPLRRDVLFVPETAAAADALDDMRRTQTHIAVVVDEYGGTSGIITLEDLVEEVLGEIGDELDEASVEMRSIEGEPPTWDVSPQLPVAQLARAGLLVDASDPDESVAHLVLERLGRLPRKGDVVSIGTGVSAELTDVARRRIVRMRVRATPTGDDGAHRDAFAAGSS